MATKSTPSIHERMASVLSEIKALEKSEKNKHGGYAYVSVDHVKDHVRPIFAKYGVSLMTSEIPGSAEIFTTTKTYKGDTTTTTHMRVTFMITAVCDGMTNDEVMASGELITVAAPYTGGQTAGALRSYAIKEWLKGKCLIATGEKDQIDSMNQQEHGPVFNPATNDIPTPKPEPAKKKPVDKSEPKPNISTGEERVDPDTGEILDAPITEAEADVIQDEMDRVADMLGLDGLKNLMSKYTPRINNSEDAVVKRLREHYKLFLNKGE